MADRPRGSGGRRTRCAGCIAVCVVRTTRFEPLQFFLCCLPAGSSSGNPIVQREYAETLISGGGRYVRIESGVRGSYGAGQPEDRFSTGKRKLRPIQACGRAECEYMQRDRKST